ncbi:MAG: peptidase E [Lysobacterales bacterium]|jgi:peptidase E
MSLQIILGPQSPHPNLKKVYDELSISGPIVSITAGWRDYEGELEDLQADISQPVEDLRIYHRAEEIFVHEPELLTLHRQRQDKLLELQRLYQLRLDPAMSAARIMLKETSTTDLLRLEQRAAISQVRALDRHHLRRIAAIHREFNARLAEITIPTAAEHREYVHQKVAQAGLVLIAGGHVAVLLNRIRLFRLELLLADKPVIAWSAGAMVLGERIVLFHDNAPQGKRNAEVLDAGLGIVKGLVPLPHARTRLDWSRRNRMALFSRRFALSKCCTLDSGSMIRIEDQRIVAASDVSVMTRSGHKKKLVAK